MRTYSLMIMSTPSGGREQQCFIYDTCTTVILLDPPSACSDHLFVKSVSSAELI